MLETDRMLERVKIDNVLEGLSIEERDIIIKDMEEIKSILNSESLSMETIALLLYFHKNYKRK